MLIGREETQRQYIVRELKKRVPQAETITNSEERERSLWSEDSRGTLNSAFRDEQDLDKSRVDER